MEGPLPSEGKGHTFESCRAGPIDVGGYDYHPNSRATREAEPSFWPTLTQTTFKWAPLGKGVSPPDCDWLKDYFAAGRVG